MHFIATPISSDLRVKLCIIDLSSSSNTRDARLSGSECLTIQKSVEGLHSTRTVAIDIFLIVLSLKNQHLVHVGNYKCKHLL